MSPNKMRSMPRAGPASASLTFSMLEALALDPGSVEANLYRVYMLLSRGEKESARHGIENLLQTAGNDWNVRLVAGQTLRIDGMYDEALEQFNASLRMNPANAAMI
jgi:eukaryotic-like serine/threonine-protein kinase